LEESLAQGESHHELRSRLSCRVVCEVRVDGGGSLESLNDGVSTGIRMELSMVKGTSLASAIDLAIDLAGATEIVENCESSVSITSSSGWS
jgi:hypothetical protein